MADPRRLFDAKDMAGAILYAKRITADEDAWPVLVNSDGSLVVNITAGSISITGTVTTSSNAGTATTINNAAGNPVNVSLTSTVVTVANTAGTVTNSVSTIPIVGRTLTGSTGSLNATSGTLIAAGTNRIKVYAFSVTTTATTSSVLSFINGAYGGNELWRVLLQAPSGANAGANLSIAPPAFLFATNSATLLRMNLSAAVPVEWSVSFFDEA